MSHGFHIDLVDTLSDRDTEALAAMLVACVATGASVGFMAALDHAQAMIFWRRVADAVSKRERYLLLARDPHDRVLGTVQLQVAMPDNQPHRADVAKMLVHPDYRRRGIAKALMQALEPVAADLGKHLLVLDTVTGSPASRLYAGLGWQSVGDIPGYALLPDGRPCATTYFYRDLRSPASVC
jgi:GNAT superfamily N-acetyltransferase